MKRIVLSKKFKQGYKRRIKGKSGLEEKYLAALQIFINNPEHPSLRNHFLKSRKRNLVQYKAFRITSDLRVIYKEESDLYFFSNIGTHKDVYGEGKS